MSLPNRFPGESQFSISAGGGINDYDQQKLNLTKAYDPLRYSTSGVPYKELPFVGSVRSPTQPTLERFEATPEEGATLKTERSTGDPSSTQVTGVIVSELNSQQTIQGNSGLTDIVRILSEISSGKRIKPDVIKKVVNKVLILQAKEKNQDYKHSMTKGLAPHLAFSNMTGHKIQEFQNIATALQSFASIPDAAALAQLPGQIMNIVSMFKKMDKKQKKRATGHMSPLMLEGLDNMLLLMSMTEDDGLNGVSSDRINPEIYMENMIELLSQCKNIGDLVDTFNRLQYDTTLRGLESYAKKSDSGLTATLINPEDDEELSYSTLKLSDIVDKSRVHFDEGFSISLRNETYFVLEANLESDIITIYPTIQLDTNEQFVDVQLLVYEPLIEYEVDSPYGKMTMTMDLNGNVKPKKDSLQKIMQAIQALSSLMNMAEGGGKNFFGDAGKLMSQLHGRIPNNIGPQVLSQIMSIAQAKYDDVHKKIRTAAYPFKR